MNFIELESQPYEACRAGKPDQLDANIAHLVAAHFLEINPDSKFNVRVTAKHDSEYDFNVVDIFGEVSGDLLEKFPNSRRNLVSEIKDYCKKILGEDYTDAPIEFHFSKQEVSLNKNDKNGDQGDPIAVAYKDTPLFLPWERFIAVEVRDLIDDIYQANGIIPEKIADIAGIKKIEGLRADGKVAINALYDRATLDSISDITVAAQHSEDYSVADLREKLGKVIGAYLTTIKLPIEPDNVPIYINTKGDWNFGSWKVDAGVSEAKPQVAYFGSYGVMEDTPWGEDPSKPSGPGTMLARNIAVQLVANNLAEFARVHVRYHIGEDPEFLNVHTKGTGTKSQQEIHKWVRQRIPLDLASTTKEFDLKSSELYRAIVKQSDIFHGDFPWNRADMFKNYKPA